jgi:hypothetical protein
VVARLTSPDQAAALAQRRFAQFTVRDLTGRTVTLQLTGASPGPSPPPALPPDLVPSLLRLAGLPANKENTLAARALLSQGLPVTPERIAELKNVLARLGAWGQAEANAGAALKAAGLPLSTATLALVLRELPPPPVAFGRLRESLRGLPKRSLPPHLARLVEQALNLLDGLEIDWGAPAPELAERLRAALGLLGRSLEAELEELARQGQEPAEKSPATKGLLLLAYLRRALAQSRSHQPLVEAVDSFMEGLRRMQFLNTETDSSPARWLNLELLLASAAPEGSKRGLQAARLRVACCAEGEARRIDPDHTRLVLQVDLEAGGSLEVDLSMAPLGPGGASRVGALLTASSLELRDLAQAELPGLAAGLERLGYSLQTARCEVGQPAPLGGLEAHPGWSNFSGVNVGV